MIELLEGKILSKNAPKDLVSFSYEKGAPNYISLEEKYKFNFLMLKNQSLDAGTFKVDDVIIYPSEQEEKSLFFLTVNSLVRIHLCFLSDSANKKQKVKDVQDRLIQLRELPVVTPADQDYKVSQIFNAIDELLPAYVLIDLNDDANSNTNLVVDEVQKHSMNVLYILLEKEKEKEPEPEKEEEIAIPIAPVPETEPAPIEDDTITSDDFDDDTLELSIGNGQHPKTEPKKKQKQSKPITVKNKSGDSFGKIFTAMAKENIMAFLSFVPPALGVIAFMLLSPLYAVTNKFLLIPFIITIVICFTLYIIMTYKCAMFDSKKQLIAYSLLSGAAVLVAFGLSVGIYFLFVNFDPDLKALQSKNTLGFIIAIIATVILLCSNFLVRPIGYSIKKLFKKK